MLMLGFPINLMDAEKTNASKKKLTDANQNEKCYAVTKESR